MGVNLGDRLIGADSHNQAGYFENPGIVDANADLLHWLDRRWTGPKGTLGIPIERLSADQKCDFEKRIREELSWLRNNTIAPFGIKDPRIARLLPLWKEILDAENIRPLFVLCVRHPLEVAKSVLHRDAIPTEQSQLLWLKHNQDAITDTNDRDVHVVIFDRWFNDLEAQAFQLKTALGTPLANDFKAIVAEIASTIQPELRHHKAHEMHYLPYIEETYALMDEMALTGSVPKRLWDLIEEIERAESLFSNWQNVIQEQVVDDRLERHTKNQKQGMLAGLLSRLSTI
jgi:hypothetical protein